MKAELCPLKGKYYGTEVRVFDIEPTDPTSDGYIQIWVMGNYKPSERELKGYELKDGKWQIQEDGEWYEYEICDSHYETETSLTIAKLLVDAINNHKDT